MGSSNSKSPNSTRTVHEDVHNSYTPEPEPDINIKTDGEDVYDEPQHDFFRSQTNSEFYNVPPPITILKDDETSFETDQHKGKESEIHLITTVTEETPEVDEPQENGIEEDIITEQEPADEEVILEQEPEEEEVIFEQEPTEVEEENVEDEMGQNDIVEEYNESPNPYEEQEEFTENMQSQEDIQGIPDENQEEPHTEENTEDQGPKVEEVTEQPQEVEDEQQAEEKEEEEETEHLTEKWKPKTALEAVYDKPGFEDEESFPLTQPPKVETVAYVEEGDDDEDEKFDMTLSAEMSEFFAKPYETMTFDFNLATGHLKPIREFVTKWGFYKAVPTPDVLKRAQKAVRHFNIPAPKTERGYPLPFPLFFMKPPDLAPFQMIESTLKLKESKSFGAVMKLIKNMKNVVHDDEVKVRIIMKWMSQHSHKIPPLGKSGKSDFAGNAQVHLFYKFCKMLNIECAVIEGRRKLYQREPSSKPGKRAVRAVWCAVLVNGHWQFVDPSLPGLKEMKKMNDEKTEPESEKSWLRTMRTKIGEYYSLPDPTFFVYTHLPDVEYWQLLCRPVLETEWYNMVCVSPFFFHYGFDLQSKVTYNVKCNGNYLILTFTYPSDKMFIFTTSIVPNPPKNPPYVCIESDFDGKSLSIEVFVRQKGTYFLHIYFKDLGSECRDFLYLCTYCLEITKPNVDAFDAFFVNARQHWGPADDTLDAGLIPVTHVTSEIECGKEFLDIVFDLQNDLNLHCSLIDKDGRDLSRHIAFWVYGKKFNIKVTCPGFQKCALEIFTKNEDDRSLRTICNYRVQFIGNNREAKPIMGFPPSMTKLGVTEAGELLNCMPLFPNPCVSTMSEETTLQFTIDPSESIIFPSLKYVSDKLYNTDSYMAWFLDDDGKLSVSINPLRDGLYLLSVQTKYSIDVVENTMLYFGLINVEIPSSQWAPYPERSVDVQRQIKILEPKTGYLRAKEEYNFSYQIKDEAQDVAMVTSNGWCHLEKKDPNIWEGTALTGPKGTDVTLNVRFEVGSQKFTKLLTYKAIDKKEYEARTKRQEQIRTQKMMAFAQDDEKVKPPEKLSLMAERHRKDAKSNNKKGKQGKKGNTSRDKKAIGTESQKENAIKGKTTNTPRSNLTRESQGSISEEPADKKAIGTESQKENAIKRKTTNTPRSNLTRESLGSISEESAARESVRKRETLNKKDDSETPQTSQDTQKEIKKDPRPYDNQRQESNSESGAKAHTTRRALKTNVKESVKEDVKESVKEDVSERKDRVRKTSNKITKHRFRKFSADSKSSGSDGSNRSITSEKQKQTCNDKQRQESNSESGAKTDTTRRALKTNSKESVKEDVSERKDRVRKTSNQITKYKFRKFSADSKSSGSDGSNRSTTSEKQKQTHKPPSSNAKVLSKKMDMATRAIKDSVDNEIKDKEPSVDAETEEKAISETGNSQDDLQLVAISEPETLSPATIARLKAKKRGISKQNGRKIAISGPAGTVASPRIYVS
ncbi:uncharacterized protein LOC133173541 [Saccostrea echinata]|uniref:uncharacterized protein LOC133173541 n=1 Tax=Saccostrea echinata TaxID=191078 RepID=UPI002A80DC21|nr:uncharacterized protein LOC133173541 [Saccostrea echinata]